MRITGNATRREFLQGMTVAGASALAATGRPNVIIILTDDQGYGDLSCHGNPVVKTPNMDRLYSQSIRLTDFHVTPMCTPSRSQIMTGRDCLANGAYRVCSGQSFIRHDVSTMADIFSANGYRTGQFGKWHLGDNFPHRPQDRGFQETVHHKGYGVGSVPDHWNNDYFNDFYWHNGALKQFQGYCTDVWFSAAAGFLEECNRRREPFLAYLATNAPHAPLFVPDKYRQPYKDRELHVASFYGMIANIDENMGRLENLLERTGLRENTIMIFMTDNGATVGADVYNAGMRGTKKSLYDGGHRVPCFIRWPKGGLCAPGDIGALTQCQDLLPTLVDLCGLRTPPGIRFDGSSLAPLSRGTSQPELAERMLVVQFGGEPVSAFTPVAKWDSAVMWNHWRLTEGRDLYNLDTDPKQQNNVAAAHPKIVAQLRDHYERWWSYVEPLIEDPVPISVGSEHEVITCLTSHDWVEVNTAGVWMVRAGDKRNGPWNILVERAGEYEISLRRWPEEANTAIRAGIPPHHPEDDKFPAIYPAGKALPVARARLKIGAFEGSRLVGGGDTAAIFRAGLSAGRTQLQTWFFNASGEELCGAYYTYIRRS